MLKNAGNIARLREELRGGEPSVKKVDELLNGIFSSDKNVAPDEILMLLAERCDDDHVVFSIIHAAEHFDDRVYVEAFLSTFPAIAAGSPRWASILLVRVLNNEASRMELIRQLRTAPSPSKSAIDQMCEKINEVDYRFLAKTVAVTAACRF